MTTLLRKAATVATALSIAGGGASLVGASSISTTGPDSTNTINQNTRQRLHVDNDNHVGVHNFNGQLAATGSAKVRDNTTGGDATSGGASNTNSTTTSLSITNTTPTLSTGGGGGSNSIDTTGPDSSNIINNNTSVRMSVDNDNSVWVSNTNLQGSFSGDATVSHNTTSGDATSGDASNTSSTSTTITITNQ